jgi:hypothetical protein
MRGCAFRSCTSSFEGSWPGWRLTPSFGSSWRRTWRFATALAVQARGKPRPRLRPSDRLLFTALSRILPRDRWRVFRLLLEDHPSLAPGAG